ncbi:4-aminobutyrate--pyruvate transaminase [Bradyrhizobium sp. USDA 4449]
MRINSASARDVQNVLHGYVELATLRERGVTVITGGKGIFIFDENGTPYLEGAGGMWCTALGFGEQELVEAAVRQMEKLPYYHTVAHKSVLPAIELAERLSEKAPFKNAKTYFSLSGSEANDFLVKAVRYYNNALGRPRKKTIIARQNGYHGSTLAATSLTGIRTNHLAFDVPIPGIVHVSDPNFFREGLPGETQDQFAQRMADELEETILRLGPDTVAAFIAEPVTGAGGVVVPPKGYYERISEILKRHDVLFLSDEVITGFYRTGKFWGCETMGFVPNTMTVAKGLTSAYQPLAATVVSNDIYEGLVKGSAEIGFFAHGATYSGHPVGCAVALKVLDILEERRIDEHVRNVAPVFARRLEQLRSHPYVGDVRYAGLMGAVEFVESKELRRYFSPEKAFSRRVRDRAEEAYKMICRGIPTSDACAFSPPLIITEGEINEMFDRFQRALDDVTKEWERSK